MNKSKTIRKLRTTKQEKMKLIKAQHDTAELESKILRRNEEKAKKMREEKIRKDELDKSRKMTNLMALLYDKIQDEKKFREIEKVLNDQTTSEFNETAKKILNSLYGKGDQNNSDTFETGLYKIHKRNGKYYYKKF